MKAENMSKDKSDCQRESEQKWNGWGYRDSYFYLDKDDNVAFAGNDRYDISGKVLPSLHAWMVENLGIDIRHSTPSRPKPPLDAVASPRRSQEFLNVLQQQGIAFSEDPLLRLNRSHGHTAKDIWSIRQGRVGRIPDCVVWAGSQGEVETIIKAAEASNVVVIPIGGGTSVSHALSCPENESRPIVSLDMCRMDKLLWVDPDNLVARAQGGVLGIELEKQLNARGYTLGHEPDSIEFSSLGGWVATRASGMKKNRYGNIEDILVHVTLVTPRGVLEKSCQVPRISAGPDVHHFVLGSEGTLGVVTEVTFKIHELPAVKKYGSILFPTFKDGVQCMRQIARERCQPASIRLVDNQQFRFGQALKPGAESWLTGLANYAKKAYVTKWKGLDPYEMTAATLVMEGTIEEVEAQEKRIYAIAQKFRGMAAGAENGRYGYMLTFAIAYLRDLGFDYSCIGESFETSVPWDKALNLCRNVKELLERESRRHGVTHPVLASCRLTQVYDAGCCIYFYFGFNYRGLTSDPLHVYEEIEEAAREEILANGGSISHHHGVGKLRASWLPRTVGPVGLSAMQAVKRELDPSNVFASGNLFTASKL